ncbi:MAG: hypothetical protein KIS95_12255 [Anaerolineae bacterium]|uniref:McrC family protein n=1 Tax=Promineifilum sp. TaxID=2664178 RepID=UPI001DA87A89|nr:hypothetical protein [Anaerolineales bacterium]MCB8935298.1 hypothetical protein [Promineifilum sp.]MCO5178918.1 McrC family protein [Promineifilum sp.]MCW5847998.1 hypothetical protein [Anaerolineae bacterium]
MATEPIILRLTENETAVTAELSPAQAHLLRERFSDHLDVQRDWESGRFLLSAKRSAGIVAVDGLRVYIEPKVPLTNLFYMLTYAYDLPLFRDEEAPLAVGDDLFAFLVDIFIKQVNGLARQGIYRNYIDFEENTTRLRGRLLLGEHLRRNVVQPVRFAQRSNDFTADLPENRILKTTLHRLVGAPFGDDELRRRLRRTLSAFAEVSLVAVRPETCDQIVYNRLNTRYRAPISLAQLFLRYLSLEGHAGPMPFMAYLLPMAEVFERFVARYLAEYFAAHPLMSVRAQESIWLDEAFREKGRLDILLRWAGRSRLIVDTKYKLFDGAPTEADRNQMFMYCHALGVSRAMLLYADARPIDYEARFPGVSLSARSLALDGSLADFRTRCRALGQGLMDDLDR